MESFFSLLEYVIKQFFKGRIQSPPAPDKSRNNIYIPPPPKKNIATLDSHTPALLASKPCPFSPPHVSHNTSSHPTPQTPKSAWKKKPPTRSATNFSHVAKKRQTGKKSQTYLVCRPAIRLVLNETLDMFPLYIIPPCLQKLVIVDILQLHPP